MKKLLSILLIVGFLAGGAFLGYATQPAQYKVNAGDARWHTKLNAGLDAIWDYLTVFATYLTSSLPQENTVTLITATPTYSNGTTFTVPGDYTSRFTAGKVVQARLAATTVETTIVSSTYASPNTTIVLTDSVLTNPITRVYVVATRDGLWPNGPGYVVAADYGTDQAALEAADAIAAAAGKQLVIGRTYSITSTPASPLTANLKVLPGGTISIANGVTLTINGTLDAGLYQIFACTGTGKVVYAGDKYPEWWGFTTDAGPAIIAALTNTGRTVFQPNKTYPVTSIITATVGSIELAGYNTIIDTSGYTGASSPFYLLGGVGTNAVMGTNPVAGATAFDCAGLSASIVAGDKLLLYSTDLWITGLTYHHGEWVTVESVSGNTINLQNALYAGYTGANTTVYKPTLAKIAMSGLKFVGPGAGNYQGPSIALAQNVELVDVESKGYAAQHIYLNWIYGGVVSNCRTHDYYHATPTDCYGMIIGSAQDLTIKESRLIGYHHGLAVGGGGTVATGWPATSIINRNINIGPGNTIDNNAAGARQSLNNHGNAEYINIFGNRILNGCGLSGINTAVDNNLITGRGQDGIAFIPQKSGDFLRASNNNIGGTAGGVTFAPDIADTVTDLLHITDNDVKVSGRAALIRACATGDTTIGDISLTGRYASTSAAVEALWIEANGGNYPILSKLMTIRGSIISTAYDAILGHFKVGSGIVKMNGVYCEGNRGAAGRGVRWWNLSDLEINGGHHSSDGAYDEYTDCTNVSIFGTKYTRYTTAGGIAVTGETRAIAANNDHSGSTGIPSFATYPITLISAYNNKTFYRATVPAAGTFAVGDRAINSNPIVGQAKSWVCTVAGAPGTWVSEGNL